MTEPSDLGGGDEARVVETAVAAGQHPPLASLPERRRQKEEARQNEALTLRMAGLSYAQVGDRLGITPTAATDLVNRTLLKQKTPPVEEFRALENMRLDRAQAAIWPAVLQGDLKAVDAYLRISMARRRMNGLDAPMEINVAIQVRQEMEQALAELERTVLGNVVLGEVLSSDDDGYRDHES